MKPQVILMLGVMPMACLGQTSAYQSTDSNSSILLYKSAANVIFNVTDAKFTAGYLHSPAAEGMLYGVSLFGKPSTSVSNQIFNTTTQDSLGGAVSIGRHVLFTKAPKSFLTDDWWAFQFTYTRSATNIVTDAMTQPQKRTFDGVKGILTYNGYKTTTKGVTFLGGFSAGVSKNNNLADLTAVTINTTALQSADGVTPAFQAVKSDSGYMGMYRTYIGAPIYSDLALLPHPKPIEWLSLDLFTRSNAAHFDRYVEGGVGLFIAEPGAPTKILGGITLAWNNGVPTWGIVAGWAF
jgi:hypothetical protein